MRFPHRPPKPDAGHPDDGDEPSPTDPLTRRLRTHYRAPDDAHYWESLEARILAAVRDGASRAALTTTGAMRAVVPAAAVEWWQALARWAAPGLAAATVVLSVAGATLLEARASAEASRAHSAFRRVLGDPVLVAPADDVAPAGGLARAFDAPPTDDSAAAETRSRERLAADLLSGGLARRHLPPLDALVRGRTPRAEAEPSEHELDAERRARREATFRYVMPED